MYGESIEQLAVLAFAALVVIVYAVVGVRALRCPTDALPRIVVASLALVIAVCDALGVVPPVVAYGLLCLAMVSVFAFDQIQEERSRKRRVASLVPRPAADFIPTVWTVSAAASPFLLTPYVAFGEQRAAAVMVGTCALVMALIAWRIASAPIQIAGGDVQYQRMHDRVSRSRRAGLTAVLAVGIIFVFTSFVNADLPVVMPVQRDFNYVSLILWAALWAWEAWYVRQLDRASCSASS